MIVKAVSVMKFSRILLKIFVFMLSALLCYYLSYCIVFVIIWIGNIFQPVPEGVDMYREANRLALEAFPDEHKVSVISTVIGVVVGGIIALWFKPERFQGFQHVQRNAQTKTVCFYNDDSEDEMEAGKNPCKESVSKEDDDEWFDHSLEEHDNEDGWCTECEEFEEDLDD